VDIGTTVQRYCSPRMSNINHLAAAGPPKLSKMENASVH
jgi:hypothetical protein